VSTISLSLHLLLFQLEKVPKLVTLALVYQILAVDLAELVVVPVDFDFECDESFVTIVVALDD
jgi:hypothetical protein